MFKHIVVTAAASAGDGAMIEAELSPWDNVRQVSPTRWYVGRSEDFTFAVDVYATSNVGADHSGMEFYSY